MMQKARLLLLTIITIFTASCASRVETVERIDLTNGGAIRLNLQSSAALSKVADVPTPAAEEFLITIASTTADESGKYPIAFEKKYGEMALSVVLEEGEYSVTATSGAHEAFSTTAPTYSATTKANIEIGQTTDIALTATISSYLVDIVYTEEFKKAFTEYYVEAHVMDDRYTFAAMSDQCAYFAPGSAKLVLKGTTATGQAYSSVIKEISSIGRERYVLTLAIRPQGHAFDVLVDTKVEQIGVNGELDPDLYPDVPKPVAGEMSFYETADRVVGDQNTMAVVSSIVSIENVELTFTEPNISLAGLEANRVYSLAVADDVAALTAAGVDFNAAIIGMRTATIDFSSLATKLLSYNNVQTSYPVTIKVTDKVQKSAQSEATIKINPPVFAVNAIPAANCWTKTATVNRAVTVSQGNVARMTNSPIVYQYSTDQSNWTTMSSDDLSGLTPGTTYYVRALYRDNIASQVATFSTETARQIPNSDFESWQDTRETKGGQQFYRWAKDGEEWWSSLNTLTCTSSGIDAWQVSQSSSRTNPGHNGLGVLIHTCGYGSGNTWAGFMWSAVIYNTKAGRLFIGEYNGGQQNGKEFNSRPTAVTYWYKFAQHPKKADRSVTRIWIENRTNGVVTTIGEGTFTATSNVNDYTQNRINITYNNTDLPATHICMEFMSGQNEGDKAYLYDKTYDKPPFANQNYYYGSRFWVDDVELIYEK